MLLEGVPGPREDADRPHARAGRSAARSRACSSPPTSCPSDLVGTRIWRPDHGDFRTELGPVFANLLLADEINRAPAKVQSALLEVMQEQQVTIAGQAYEVPRPFLVLATQNPIESEGTYQLPEAQVDRFLFKLLVDYPAVEDEVRVLDLLDGEPVVPRAVLAVESLLDHRRAARAVYVDRTRQAVRRRSSPTRRATRARHGLPDLEGLIEYGASPRASIGLMQGAQALALLRGRTHATTADVRDLAADVLRHRLVLSYDALADGVSPDALDRPRARAGRRARGGARGGMTARRASSARPAARARAACPPAPWRGSTSRCAGASRACCPASTARPAPAAGPSSRSCARTSPATTPARFDAAASARTGVLHVREHVPERALTTWLVCDVSASMGFGTALRLKSDVGEGVGDVISLLAVRRGGRIGLVRCGAPRLLVLRAARRPRRARAGARRAARGRRARRHTRRGRRSRDARRRARARAPGRDAAEPRRRRLGLPRRRAPGSARCARSARATSSSRSRSPTRARARCPTRASSSSSIPRPASSSRSTPPTPRLRAAFEDAERARRAEVAAALRGAAALHVALGTDEDWLRALARRLR